jgi:hypothetical protein
MLICCVLIDLQFYVKRGFLLPKFHNNYWLGLNTSSTNGNWAQMDRTFTSKYRLWGTYIGELLLSPEGPAYVCRHCHPVPALPALGVRLRRAQSPALPRLQSVGRLYKASRTGS